MKELRDLLATLTWVWGQLISENSKKRIAKVDRKSILVNPGLVRRTSFWCFASWCWDFPEEWMTKLENH